MIYTYPVDLQHLFISPGHNYFGKPKDGPGQHPTHDMARVELKAGLGLVGDRYFAVPAHFNAQVTFVASEVLAAVQAEFGLPELSPLLTRRNIVTAGVPLNQLVGQEFTLRQGEWFVRFQGARPCSPCGWMDAMITPGAWKFLRGRGGLRAQVLTDGWLQHGAATLETAVELDLRRIAEPLAVPKLP